MTFLSQLFWWLISLFLVFLFLHTVLRVVRRFYSVPAPAIATRIIDNPVRRRFIQRPDVVADRMRLEPRMTVVEIGPGKGSYTMEVARRVAPGIVYAIDIQGEVIDRLRERTAREGITNLHPRVDDAYAMSFEDGSVDRVFMIACLPEIPDPVRVLRECHRILRPGGLVSLSELFMDPDYPLKSTEIRWAREAGLELDEEFGNWWVYQLNFVKSPRERN